MERANITDCNYGYYKSTVIMCKAYRINCGLKKHQIVVCSQYQSFHPVTEVNEHIRQ